MSPQPDPIAAPEPATILVVEDEVLIRLMIAQELRAAGFTVIEAVNASEALAVLHTPRRVDAVMTDIRIPGSMDGLGLASMVRSNWPGIKIIIASAYAPDALAREIEHSFIGKPYRPDRVIELIKKLLKGEDK
jgi:DNA-binding NtrC family response regulator